MKFLYPEFLWAFTVLIIPIVIHLFNFKRYKTLYFSSLNFVKQVDQKTKSTQKLKHLLVLLSRLLAFTFLVLAFAQPFIPNSSEASKAEENLIVFYIDNSFSMQAKGAEGELLSQARENARKIIEDAPLDAQFIIGTNEMSGIEDRILTKVEALEVLDKIDLSPIFRTAEEILEWQSKLIDGNSNEGKQSVRYVYLSDFQKSSGFGSPKLTYTNFQFYPIQLKPERNTNVYIDSVWFSSPVHKPGQSNEINIQIVNTHSNSLENVELNVTLGEFKKTLYVSLPAKEKYVTQLTFNEKSAGTKNGQISVVDDFVHFDDTYFLSYKVRENSNILILDGEDAIPNIGVVYDLEQFYVSESRNVTNVTIDDFQEKDLVVINGANTLSTGISNYLIEFVEGGGSIALFPGGVPDKNDWNYLLERVKLPRLGQAVTSGNKIKSINYDDPFFKSVFEEESERLNLPSVTTTFLPITSTNSLSIDLVNLQNGLPLLTQSSAKGSAFMFYSSLIEKYGSFTKDALFSTLLLRMGEISQRSQPNYIIIGQKSRYPIYEKLDKNSTIHVRGNDLDFIPESSSTSGVTYISINLMSDQENFRAGNYNVETDRKLGSLSLNYDRQESDLDSYSEDEIVSKLKNAGISSIQFAEIGAGSTVSVVDIDKPFGYWKICIVLTLIFVLIEMALIRLLK